MSDYRTTNWCRNIINYNFPQIKADLGVDLDGSGKIENSESFGDINNNGSVYDSDDYYLYMAVNRKLIANKIEFIGSGINFSQDNPIHELLSPEAVLLEDEHTNQVFFYLNQILEKVKLYSINEDLTGRDKLTYLWDCIMDLFEFSEEGVSLLSDIVTDMNVDCDTSSIIVVAISYEMNWPVLAVNLSDNHMFTRWEDDSEYFNFDQGYVLSDDEYFKSTGFEIPEDCIDIGDIMSLKISQLISIYHKFSVGKYANKAVSLTRDNRFFEALELFDKVSPFINSIMDKQFIEYFLISKATCLLSLKKYPETIVFLEGIESPFINQKFSYRYYSYLSWLYMETKEYDKALRNLELVVTKTLDPIMISDAYTNMGIVYEKMDNIKMAIEFYQLAIETASDSSSGKKASLLLHFLKIE